MFTCPNDLVSYSTYNYHWIIINFVSSSSSAQTFISKLHALASIRVSKWNYHWRTKSTSKRLTLSATETTVWSSCRWRSDDFLNGTNTSCDLWVCLWRKDHICWPVVRRINLVAPPLVWSTSEQKRFGLRGRWQQETRSRER